MFDKPKNLIWWRILAAVALVAILAIGGTLLYNAGVNHGALAGAEGDLALPDFSAHGYHMPMRGSHFFPGSFFFGLLFFILIFGLIRRVIFGPRWANRMHGMGGFHRMNWKEGAEKWHAEMHDRMENPPTEPEADQATDE